MLSSILLVGLFLVWSDCSYIAEPREGHYSTLIEDVLMIYGGQTTVNGALTKTNTLILLPVNQSFDLTSPPYESNSGISNPGPTIYGGVIFPGGPNHDELLIYGGNVDGNVELSSYDQESNAFNSTHPPDNGTMPCNYHSGVVNITLGRAYIFGGAIFPGYVALNGLWILNTTDLVWSMFSSHSGSTPLARLSHTATLTTDGRMIVIGGQTTAGAINAIVPMSNIDIFDTISQQWSNVTAFNPPQARYSHTAVCTHSNQIIVFGGSDNYSVPLGDLIVLNMNTLNLSWSTPNTSGLAPTPRYGHSATMVGTIMFIIYGQVSNTTADSKIYGLDTAMFTWVTNYTPNHLEYTWSFNISTNDDNSSNTGLSKVIIIIIIVIVTVIFVCVCVIGFRLYCHAKHPELPCTESETRTEVNSPPQINVRYERPNAVEDSQKIELDDSEDWRNRKPDDIV